MTEQYIDFSNEIITSPSDMGDSVTSVIKLIIRAFLEDSATTFKLPMLKSSYTRGGAYFNLDGDLSSPLDLQDGLYMTVDLARLSTEKIKIKLGRRGLKRTVLINDTRIHLQGATDASNLSFLAEHEQVKQLVTSLIKDAIVEMVYDKQVLPHLSVTHDLAGVIRTFRHSFFGEHIDDTLPVADEQPKSQIDSGCVILTSTRRTAEAGVKKPVFVRSYLTEPVSPAEQLMLSNPESRALLIKDKLELETFIKNVFAWYITKNKTDSFMDALLAYNMLEFIEYSTVVDIQPAFLSVKSGKTLQGLKTLADETDLDRPMYGFKFLFDSLVTGDVELETALKIKSLGGEVAFEVPQLAHALYDTLNERIALLEDRDIQHIDFTDKTKQASDYVAYTSENMVQLIADMRKHGTMPDKFDALVKSDILIDGLDYVKTYGLLLTHDPELMLRFKIDKAFYEYMFNQ